MVNITPTKLDPEQAKAQIPPATWLALAALLPTLGIGLWLTGQLLNDFSTYGGVNDGTTWRWDEILWPDIGFAASWLLPLVLGVVVAGLLRLRWKRPAGLATGALLIGLAYQALCWNYERHIAECSQTSLCGEWAILTYGFYYVTCAVNVLALAGCMALLSRYRANQKPAGQPENPEITKAS
jgi:hypothetical protein